MTKWQDVFSYLMYQYNDLPVVPSTSEDTNTCNHLCWLWSFPWQCCYCLVLCVCQALCEEETRQKPKLFTVWWPVSAACGSTSAVILKACMCVYTHIHTCSWRSGEAHLIFYLHWQVEMGGMSMWRRKRQDETTFFCGSISRNCGTAIPASL